MRPRTTNLIGASELSYLFYFPYLKMWRMLLRMSIGSYAVVEPFTSRLLNVDMQELNEILLRARFHAERRLNLQSAPRLAALNESPNRIAQIVG